MCLRIGPPPPSPTPSMEPRVFTPFKLTLRKNSVKLASILRKVMTIRKPSGSGALVLIVFYLFIYFYFVNRIFDVI